MTVAEFIEHLKTFPQDLPVCYTDAAFGSRASDVEEDDIEVRKDNDSDGPYLKIARVGCDCSLNNW